MDEVFLGIDIGGTTIKIGLFDKKIDLCEKWEIPTNRECNGKYILNEIAQFINKKWVGKKIYAAGIGVPGAVESDEVVTECVNIGWGKTNVKEIFEGLTGINTVVLNDANAAAFGELCDEYKNMVLVTIGTGIGAGIVLNGNVINGYNGVAGEIGHITVNTKETEKCSCGKCGCLEQYSSATGMKKYAKKLILEGHKTCLNENFEVKDIVKFAEAGDKLCCDVIDFMAYNMALALSTITCIINPEVVLIGGGVSKGGDIIIKPIEKYYKKFAFASTKYTHIKIAKMGNDAGIYGAAKAAIKKYADI